MSKDDFASDDADVLQAVFDDMLSKDNKSSPPEWHQDQSKPIYVSKDIPQWQTNASDILTRPADPRWSSLTKDQMAAVVEAANNLVARAEKGDSLPDLKSTSGQLKIYEDAGAATQPTPGKPFSRDRPSKVFLPGYSKDGRYAVVSMGFPWSGDRHSGEVTYVLERTDIGWKVMLRAFVFYT